MARNAVTVHLDGADGLLKKLQKLKVPESEARAVMKDAAQPLYDETYRNTPYRTGRLRSDLSIQEDPRAAEVHVGFGEHGFYATFFEFGTRFLAATHFFSRAFRRTKDSVVADARKRLEKIIERAVR